jgi:hypothetical protein
LLILNDGETGFERAGVTSLSDSVDQGGFGRSRGSGEEWKPSFISIVSAMAYLHQPAAKQCWAIGFGVGLAYHRCRDALLQQHSGRLAKA